MGKYIIVFVVVIAASLLWRYIFWKIVTSSKKNKSWTLLPNSEVRTFRNVSTFEIGFVWLVTFLTFDLGNAIVKPGSDATVLLMLKIFMVMLSALVPTVLARLDLQWQIKRTMED